MKSNKLRLLNVLTLLVLLVSVLPAAVTAAPPRPNNAGQAPEPQLQVTTEGMNPTLAAPPQPMAPVDLVLDDGSGETTLGIGDASGFGIQFIWMNRFTPSPTDFPFDLEEIWVNFANTDVPLGGAIDLIVYEDTDGDGDPSNATVVAVYNDVVQFNNGTWSVYTLSPPLTLNGPGDVLIGVVNRYMNSGVDPQDHPATLDQTASAGRSWLGWYSGDPPDPPVLPPNLVWAMIDSFGYPGNWLIRGYGETSGETGWLEGYVMDSETGDVEPTCTDAIVHVEPGNLDIPADPATGYYGPMGLLPGTYMLEALAPGYSLETAIVNITIDMTTTQDFNLWRPVVEIAPTDFISVTAYISQETTYPLIITNSGHLPLEFEIYEEAGLPLAAAAARSYKPAAAAEGVDPTIYTEMADAPDGKTEFFVAFQDTADLAPAYAMDWSERGQFVVNALKATAQASQANVAAWLDARGIEYTSFWINNTLFVRADEATLNELATFPEVAGFRANRVYEIMPTEAPSGEDPAPTTPAYPWNITFPMADQVHTQLGITGEGVVIGGMDTGVEYDHIGLVNNYRGNLGGGNFDHTYSWYDPDGGCAGPDPCDTDTHGTSTMGIMAGDDDPSLPNGAWIGMAPDAEWIHCVGCPNGSCPASTTTACAQWFLAPGGDPDMRPQVVNHSWGLWSPDDCNGNNFQSELMAYRAADIVPAFAAGNVGDYVTPPHCYASTSPANNTDPSGNPIAFSSGAHDSAGTLDYYSSGGPSACNNDNLFPDVASPGQGSCTTGLNDTYNCSFGGTSSASPHTAGCVALVRSANPTLTVDEVEQVIRDTANDVDDGCGTPPETPDWNNLYGEGHLDCYEAVSSILLADLPWVWEDPVNGTIPDLQQFEVNVTFHCTETRDYEGTLHIIHNDPCASPIDVPIVLHCLEPQQTEWGKWINGVEWYPGIEFTLETSDTIEVIDVITTLQDFVLVEFWDPAELGLLDAQATFGDIIITPGDPFMLEWIVPPGPPEVVALTKLFHVEPCTWTETILQEELWVGGVEVEQRPVTFFKLAPDLWIDADYEQEVLAGEQVTFTLLYGNAGGFENDVMVRNEFPPEAPFLSSVPPADRWAADGSWAEWDVGDLPGDSSSNIDVSVAISETLEPCTWITITDWIYDHVGDVADVVTITLHVTGTECIELTGITILGATSGEPGTYTFTTTYEPTNATPPITYLWDNGDTTDISIRPLTVGTHTLTVEASNCDDVSVNDVHTIVITAPTICTDVTDVDLTVLTPAPIYPGDPVDLSADIAPDEANKPYNYRLTVDGTPGSVMASIADPLAFTHTFTTTGNHTIEIAVWNCVMSEDEAVMDDVVITVVEEEERHYIYLPTILKNYGP